MDAIEEQTQAKLAKSNERFLNSQISVIDGTIGGLADLGLGEAQTLNFGACRLPETRWTQNTISFLKQDAAQASPCNPP